ncbi:FAD-dependent oxidoreductase, partial [Nocardioides sp. J9]|uniref:FAD-dependent oxidoreductase n=1 Tax=Nocardioides sp. J9 TaxID=935844 RepID=UPI0021BDBA77
MNIVIIGGGLAAAKATEELRTRGHSGDIVVVAAEPHRPYERPPLSKGVLLGKEEPSSAYVHDEGWYDEHDVELLSGTPASAIDLDTCHVVVGDRRL